MLNNIARGESPRGVSLRKVAICGERLKYYRKLLGWTQEELASRSGYSDRLIRKAEGGHTLSYDTIQNLAQTLSSKSKTLKAYDLISSPQRNARLLIDFGFSGSSDIRLVHEFAAMDCKLEFDGEPRIPLTGTWVGVEGLFRWLVLFHQNINGKILGEDAVVVVDDDNGFIHLRLVCSKSDRSANPDSVDFVLKIRFRNCKICNVIVLTDESKLKTFIRSR